MLTIILWIVLGYYLLNFSVVLSKFLFRWIRSVRSKNCWFDMTVRGPAHDDDPYSYLSISPWLYDEDGRHFTFGFTLLGFRMFFVPVQTIGEILREHFKGIPAWQVLHDSSRVAAQVQSVECSGSPSRTGGFSPGTDIIFFSDREFDQKSIGKFANKAGTSIVPGRLVDHVREVFDPVAFIVKDANEWVIAQKDPDARRPIIMQLFARVAERVLEKNGIIGRAGVTDAADRFMARGQVKWWMKGSMRGNEVVIEGDGLRPGEMTSADWALVTIPVSRSGDTDEHR